MTEGNYLNTTQISQKKRVLFVITQSEYGGAQRFLYNLVSRLEKDNFEILVANGSTFGLDFLTDSLNDIGVKTMKIDSLRREANLLSDLNAVKKLRKAIREFKPDILFLISSKAGFIGSLATIFPHKLNGIRVIYRIGGWSFNDPRAGWQKIFFKILERVSARWKDVIIVNNKHDLDQAQRLKIRPKEKVLFIPNGLDVYKLDFFEKDEARLKLFEKISKNSGKIFHVKKIVGTIANFYPTKGLNYLIEAVENLKEDPGLVFFIIGDGPERPNLEKLINEKGLKKKVFLLGQIPDAFRFLPAFDVFVLPSIKEGFPWALIEAMAAKLPVIATAVGAVPEIIEDGKNGALVEPSNPSQLAGRIRDILENEIRQKERGIQAHQTIVLKYDLQKMVRQIEEIM